MPARIGVVVPTLNAAADWPRFSAALLGNISPDQVLILDSSSDDGTRELAAECGFAVESIARAEFNHGATRQRGVEYFRDADVLVFLTQDAELASTDAVRLLAAAFDEPSVGAAYGRQLPRREAGAIEAHARLFNYPAESGTKSLVEGHAPGFKAIFFSNSFGAYRRAALEAVGGFPSDVILGEDTVTVARMLQRGWSVRYVAEAMAYHSHAYTAAEEFRRYFDIGVLHARHAQTFAPFGRVGGEGRRFLQSELRYVGGRTPVQLPALVARAAAKFAGYHLGRREHMLPAGWKPRLSMSKSFWRANREAVAQRQEKQDQLLERDKVHFGR